MNTNNKITERADSYNRIIVGDQPFHMRKYLMIENDLFHFSIAIIIAAPVSPHNSKYQSKIMMMIIIIIINYTL